MKKILFFVFCILFLSCLNLINLFADEITIGADNWCPYNCDINSDKPGFMVEIAQCVFEKAGHKVKYIILPWTRAVDQVKKGELTAAIGTDKDEISELIFPEVEQGFGRFCLYADAQNNWKYRGLHSLNEVKLGIIKDYSYEKSVDNYIKSHKESPQIIASTGDDALNKNIKAVLSKRIDVLIESQVVMKYVLHKTKQTEAFKCIECLDDTYLLYIGFSPVNPKSKDYAKILSDGTQELRKSGKLKAILEKYGLQDWK